jgi:hypothetical protein
MSLYTQCPCCESKDYRCLNNSFDFVEKKQIDTNQCTECLNLFESGVLFIRYSKYNQILSEFLSLILIIRVNLFGDSCVATEFSVFVKTQDDEIYIPTFVICKNKQLLYEGEGLYCTQEDAEFLASKWLQNYHKNQVKCYFTLVNILNVFLVIVILLCYELCYTLIGFILKI